MKEYLFITLLSAASFSCNASFLIDEEQVTNQKSCFSWAFNDYDSWRSIMKKKFERRFSTSAQPERKFSPFDNQLKHVLHQSNVKVENALAKFDARFGKEKFDFYKSTLDCNTFNYQVDGHTVKGYVIKPKIAEGKLPVLVYNRGGNGNYGAVVFGAMMHNLFPIAEQGFVIIGSQYRGTFTKNATADDEFGGSDVDDVTALLGLIPHITGADDMRVGMYGASRGGMQTHLAVKQVNNIKAIATIAGSADLLKGLTYRQEMENVYKKRIPQYDKNKVVELKKRSVMNWVSELSPNIPILILHGTADKRVSVNHSIDLAKALSEHKIPHKLVLYPDDNHGLNQHKEKANQELVNWFKQYL